MKKLLLLLLLSLSGLISCDDFWDNPGKSEYLMNEHYIVIDWSNNEICNNNQGLEIYWNGQLLQFIQYEFCFGSNDMMYCPTLKTANIWPDCIDENYVNESCEYINRSFILTQSCRLFIDVDSLKSNPNFPPKELYESIHGQTNEPFYINLEISDPSINFFQTIDATFLPFVFDEFENCRSTGYKESEYNDLYECLDTIPSNTSF